VIARELLDNLKAHANSPTHPCRKHTRDFDNFLTDLYLEHYIKSVPESVRVAVESLDHLLKSNQEILRRERRIESI